MSVGYNAILKIKRLEQEADTLGFRLAYPKHRIEHDTVALIPKDGDSVPVFSRDTEFWTGDITEVHAFLHGIMWARRYDELLAVSNKKLRDKKEQSIRNKQLLAQLKNTAVGPN